MSIGANVAVVSRLPLPLGAAPLTFAEWVQALIDRRYRTSAAALGQALGISGTSVQRGMDTGTFSLENLLMLAKLADERPSVVLRMAGKKDEAELIESLYGPATLTPSQRELLAFWDAITDEADRAAVLRMLRKMAGIVPGADLPDGARTTRRAASRGTRPRARGSQRNLRASREDAHER